VRRGGGAGAPTPAPARDLGAGSSAAADDDGLFYSFIFLISCKLAPRSKKS
jgi:hypothetical protein